MKNLMKILLINIAVVAVFFVIAEVGARAYFTLKTCLSGECDEFLFTRFNLFNENKMIGLSTTDPLLGYKPNPGFSAIIHHPPGWDQVYVSIDQHGFRRHVDDNHVSEHSGERLLAVGDSFTFGDQVKNSDTWPACIAQQTRLDVWNGGVFGYGAAQAVLRAEQTIANHGPFDIIIWSITVASDFKRDQLRVRSNFPKPHIASVEGETMMVPTGYFDPSPDFMWLLGYSVILHEHLLPIIQKEGDFFYDGRYKVRGERAAEIEDIIDFSMQSFAGINGTKKKSILLQYDPWIFSERDLERINEERKLIVKYGEKYNIVIIDSFDQVYVPEKRDELWFGYKDFGHHTPYGNKAVCDVVLKWLDRDTSQIM
ncbi:MAG: hypothetical protein ABIU05_03615 [Nitrospirales bacterium]